MTSVTAMILMASRGLASLGVPAAVAVLLAVLILVGMACWTIADPGRTSRSALMIVAALVGGRNV